MWSNVLQSFQLKKHKTTHCTTEYSACDVSSLRKVLINIQPRLNPPRAQLDLQCWPPCCWCQVTLHRRRHYMRRVSPTTEVQCLRQKSGRTRNHTSCRAALQQQSCSVQGCSSRCPFISLPSCLAPAFLQLLRQLTRRRRKTKSSRAPAATLMRSEQARRFSMLGGRARNHVKLRSLLPTFKRISVEFQDCNIFVLDWKKNTPHTWLSPSAELSPQTFEFPGGWNPPQTPRTRLSTPTSIPKVKFFQWAVSKMLHYQRYKEEEVQTEWWRWWWGGGGNTLIREISGIFWMNALRRRHTLIVSDTLWPAQRPRASVLSHTRTQIHTHAEGRWQL